MATAPVYSPRFDVKEHPTNYELHGELPGIDQKDIEIEFSDSSTLTIRGRTYRYYERDARSPNPSLATAIALSNPPPKLLDTPTEDTKKFVEVEKSPQEVAQESEAQIRNGGKYWVAERMVGEFVRTFSFPVEIEMDEVKAGMKSGVLTLIAPKARARGGRRVII